MDRLRRLWRGEVPIGQVFWNWVVFGGLLVNITTTAAFFVLLALDRPWLALLVHYAPSLPYNLFVLMVMWRSADRQRETPVMAELYRWLALGGLIVLSFV